MALTFVPIYTGLVECGRNSALVAHSEKFLGQLGVDCLRFLLRVLICCANCLSKKKMSGLCGCVNTRAQRDKIGGDLIQDSFVFLSMQFRGPEKRHLFGRPKPRALYLYGEERIKAYEQQQKFWESMVRPLQESERLHLVEGLF